jgi:S-methylmethionine-dependent homocysteine/selenocysteine methylase
VCGSYKPDAFIEEDALTMLHIFKRALLPYVDIILAETQSSIAEMRAILQVFSRCSKPLWISLTLEDENFTEEPRLRSGEKLVDALSHVDRNAVQAILFNCSQPEVMAAAVELSRKELTSKIDIGVYANGFEPITNTIEANDGYSSIRQDLSSERYLEFAQQWKSLGASIVGGCCGIGTEHIAALAVLKD